LHDEWGGGAPALLARRHRCRVERRGLPLDHPNRIPWAFGHAGAEPVAVALAHQDGLAFHEGYGSLVACVDAEAAAVTLVLIDLHHLAYGHESGSSRTEFGSLLPFVPARLEIGLTPA
jgi:hypothetical protein